MNGSAWTVPREARIEENRAIENFYEVFSNKWTIESVTDAIIIFRNDVSDVLSSKVNTESIVCGQLEGEK